jgi:hypothetical protein
MGETFPQTAEANPYALEWSDILFKEEKILWQGQPYAGVKLSGTDNQKIFMGLVFCGFTGVSIFNAVDRPLLSWLFTLSFFLVGLGSILSPFLYDPFRRRCTYYTLTSERAFIASKMPYVGKKLDSFPINKSTAISFDDAELASVYFASREKNGEYGTVKVPTGFVLIPDGRKVFALFRQIQSEAK